jgi:hypothetical protein
LSDENGCTGPSRAGWDQPCGEPRWSGEDCRGHYAQMQRERERAREEGRKPRPRRKVLQPLRERNKAPLEALNLRVRGEALEALDRLGAGSRGEAGRHILEAALLGSEEGRDTLSAALEANGLELRNARLPPK